MAGFEARREEFATLHERGCFVIPNPWDAGSARHLAGLGFPALATTSAGFSFALGRADAPDALTLEETLANVRTIVEATDLPVNADFQAGYASDARGVADNVRRCIGTGVAGLSIEDARADRARPLYDVEESTERVAAARRAIDDSKTRVLLTARAECHLTGHARPLEESVRRLRAYAEAGADVLYAPGVREGAAIRELVQAVAPKPLNVLINFKAPFDVPALAALGVRRISVGSTLARVALTAFDRAARELRQGSFAPLGDALSMRDIGAWFGPRA